MPTITARRGARGRAANASSVSAGWRGDNADPLGGMPGVDGQNKRYTVELYAQSYNTLNRVNALNVSGVVGSPFFGQPTSAAPPRRVEVGTRFTF